MKWWVLRRKVHPSWLISLICLGAVIGVFWTQYFRVGGLWLTLNLILSIICVVACFWKRYVCLLPLALLAGMIFGLWRGSLVWTDLMQYDAYFGKNIRIEGSACDDVYDNSGTISIQLCNIQINAKNMTGKVWVSTSQVSLRRGDRLVAKGNFLNGFGSFAGVIYRAEIIEIDRSKRKDFALDARDWFSGRVKKSISSPESSLGIGFLLGQKGSLPADLILALQMAGLTHIVVASGYNLTILVRLAKRLFEKISKYLVFLISTILIISFLTVTGLSPSMSRASLVAGLSLAAWYYGRNFHPLVILPLVAAITLIFNPSFIWGDLGWALSFAAFIGVMIFAPLLQHYLFNQKKMSFIAQLLIETLSAQIMTMPILIAAFGQVSNVAIIANILVLPLVPLAMLLTFLAGLGTAIMPGLSSYFGLPAEWLLGYMINVSDYLASLPWAISEIRLSLTGLIICYIAILLAVVYLWRKTKYNLREVDLVE